MNTKLFILSTSILLVLTTPFLARAKNLSQTRNTAKAMLQERAPKLFSERVSCNTIITVSGKFSKLCRRRFHEQ